MNVVFIAAGPYSWGSSRMRAYWVARKMDADVEMFDGLRKSPHWPLKHDVFIWQKSFDIEFIKAHQDRRHYWDVCDPIWWFSPGEVEALIPWIDGVVCSSQALADDLREWGDYKDMPIITIPDRLDLAHFPVQRWHEDLYHDPNYDIGQKAPARFIWFGVAVNRVSLHGALTNLARLAANGYQIELTLFDDRPDLQIGKFDFPVYHVRWDVATENAVIAAHDIALLPTYPGPWGKVKSDNKYRTALACGLPYTTGLSYKELEMLIRDFGQRQHFVDSRSFEGYDVAQSAKEWIELCHF